jgi:hypothetical protein
MLVSSLALSAAFTIAATALGSDANKHEKTAKASPGLDQFKQLAGEWVGKMTEDGKDWHDATVKYTVTSAGSAVVETLGPGTEHEMVTIIHQDGKNLGLTHFCGIGNQPRMKAQVKGDSNVFEFEFTGASNMDSPNDFHMHSVTYTIVDKDTLKAVWTSFNEGKKTGTATFEVKRKK